MMINATAPKSAVTPMIAMPPQVGPMPPLDRNGKATVGQVEVGLFMKPGSGVRYEVETTNTPGINLGNISVEQAAVAVGMFFAEPPTCNPGPQRKVGFALRRAADGIYAHELTGSAEALKALSHLSRSHTVRYIGSTIDYAALVLPTRTVENEGRYPMMQPL